MNINTRNMNFVKYNGQEMDWVKLNGNLVFENYKDKVVSGNNSIALNKAKANTLEYLKLYGGCKQKNSELPVSYTKIDYIETDGNCWIEIPIVPDENTEFEVTASHITSPACQLMITQQSISNNYFNIGKATATQKVISRCGSQTLTSTIDGVDKFTAIANRSSFYVNGTKVGDFTAETINGLGYVDIFRGVYAANIYYTAAEARVHEVIIRNSGTEVFHGYPAKNSANTIGLYDTVSGTFLTNKGSGALIAGADIAPSPTYIMPIYCNNGELSICRESGLPIYGYTKLDYVKNSSSTRIKTNIIPTVDDIEIELRCRAVTDSWYMFQSRASSSATTYGLAGSKSGNTINFSWGGTSVGTDFARTAGHILTIKATAKNGYMTLYVKDETSNVESFKTKTYSPSSYPSSSFYLWGNYSQYLGANANIYYLKFKVGGVTMCEYIPAKDGNDVAGFYDRATNTFIGTPTAGTMTGGDVETDNIGAYVEGTEETAIVNYFDRTSMVVTKKGIVTTSGDTLGTETANNGYNCSTYIKVLPSTMYTTILPKASTISTLGLVYYSGTTVDSAISGVPLITQISATYTFTTPQNCNYIRFTWSNTQGNDVKLIQIGNTATAQNLFAVGTYKDIQEVLTGNITRNIGIKALDGTEGWTYHSLINNMFATYFSDITTDTSDRTLYCTHFKSSSTLPAANERNGYCILSSGGKVGIGYDAAEGNVSAFTTFLSNQYANGTPVIVLYPLATPTTETVTGQALSLQKGNNTVQVTQASLSSLQLEAKYKGK